MIARLQELRAALGGVGVSSLLVLAAAVGLQLGFVRPLEARAGALDMSLESLPADTMKRVRAFSPTAGIAEFYRFFDTTERIDESLARLHGIATAAGLELRAAEYRLAESKQRLEGYEISLPVQGSYAQIRLFLLAALAELPTLSLDRAVLRRKSASDARVEADLVLTLHRLRK